MLTSRLRGVDVVVGRPGAAGFALFYDLGDAIVSISTRVLALATTDAPSHERDALVTAVEVLFAAPIKNPIFGAEISCWIVALVSAGVAFYHAGAPRLPLVVLAPLARSIDFEYASPFGSLTLGFSSLLPCGPSSFGDGVSLRTERSPAVSYVAALGPG